MKKKVNCPIRPTRAEINLDNLIFNLNNIKNKAGDKKICAVVKADAYGHGFRTIKELESEGVDYFAVAFVEEGINLRINGIEKTPILILGGTLDDHIPQILEYNLEPTVYQYEFAKNLSEAAKKEGKVVPVHIKIDTGMGRIGFHPNEAVEEIKKINELEGIELKGIFTHFATADSKDKEFTNKQIKLFNNVINDLKEEGIDIPIKHAENSAALMDIDGLTFDMVRPGIILYGLYPSEEVNYENLDLKPVMKFLTKVIHLKQLHKGDSVGYGRTYIAPEERDVSTLNVGYADGYSRMLSHKGTDCFINGQRAPILGNICMDQCIIDTTGNNTKVGDDVELFGENISADEIANKLGTINYEVTCMVNKRVPRVYKKDEKIVEVDNEIL